MNINTIANNIGVQPLSLKRQLSRWDLGTFTLNEPLPENVIQFIEKKRKVTLINGVTQKDVIHIEPLTPQKKETSTSSRKTTVKKRIDFIKLLQSSSLPMLGLAASYGVFVFASHFFPPIVAIIEAGAFELTYIGLATMKGLSEKQKMTARNVAVGALVTSIVYNTLAGALIMEPSIFDDLNPFSFWLVAIVHGAPLAVLAYFVSTLVFNSKK